MDMGSASVQPRGMFRCSSAGVKRIVVFGIFLGIGFRVDRALNTLPGSACLPDPRIERFPSQPFFTTEVFIGKHGNLTPLSGTIRGFREMCDGDSDHLPEQAFMYVGRVEEAADQARGIEAAAKA